MAMLRVFLKLARKSSKNMLIRKKKFFIITFIICVYLQLYVYIIIIINDNW